MTNIEDRTNKVRQEAYRLGFDACGFARARRLDKEARLLEEWLMQGRHGTMQWMENHFEKRVDPTKLVPGSKSVISVLCSYNQNFSKVNEENNKKPKISKYALGEDYHSVLKSKLYALYHFTKELTGELNGRVFVDSAPVLDKAWAVESGTGWLGKNSNVLNKELGSWFFIGEMIVDAEFRYDEPGTDHCGTCTQCIDACPTNAIYEPYKVDSNKCISYLTIELRQKIPDDFHEAIGPWMYGCDICQDVCPWNRKAKNGNESKLHARGELLERRLKDWEELDPETYEKLFHDSAVKRAGYKGLKRNIEIVSKNLSRKKQK